MSYLNIGPHTIHHGDSRDVLATLPDNSISACVCDPPYALVSIVKRFGQPGAAPAKGNDAYARASAGFMGQSWDTGEVAFATEFWAQVLRVLKPGGHVVAFSGTRTYHRLAVAIEDSGFEIRDQLAWVYGSGFPKSHDVSKAIDKVSERLGMFGPFAKHYADRRKASGLTHNAICEVGKFYAEHNHGGASTNWEKGNNVPTLEQWGVLQPLLGLSDEWLPLIKRVEAEREVVGKQSGTRLAVAPGQENDRSVTDLDITRPATPQAQQWEGWGTALKPAWEPIVLARKPLIGTVAANVLEHGTGAINIDGCRIEASAEDIERAAVPSRDNLRIFTGEGVGRSNETHDMSKGRFPANILHDGKQFGENGRYFYSPKASKKDRGEGNTHPTVKPTDLMAYLCRLVTPPGGVVLDPFMGSGSTGKGAHAGGFRFIGIERESEYFEIAAARLMDLT